MEHTLGFTRSHWMPPSGECYRRGGSPMVDDFGEKYKSLTKNYFLLANLYGRPNPKAMRILYPKMDSLLSSLMRQASFKCEMPQLELKS
jgi:hypothetical protein